MVTAQILKATHNVHDGFKGVADKVVGVDDRVAREVIQQAADGVDRVERSWFPNRIHAGHVGSIILTGNQLRQDLRRWLSPPDPSTNQNIACNAHHEGTASWFFRGGIYQNWKSTNSEPLLWIYGKRAPLSRSRLTPPDRILCV